ncbi:MAG: hypothetical protein Fur0016_15610 [Anaerolineales bacterium]
MKFSLLFLVLILTACAPQPAAPPATSPPVVSVYASPAAEPWLEDVFACGTEIAVVIRLSASESAAEIRLRLGEPESLSSPAYQIGTEDMLVVTRRESPIENLERDQAQTLFSTGGENVQVWVYASSADVQEIFEREVMRGTRIHPSARLALHPQQLVDALQSENNAAGLLPRRWANEQMREVFALRNLPVLAITRGEPQGAVKELIACLQK